MTVADLFAAAGLTPQGPKVWLEPVDEHRPGVYVIALVAGTAETTPATVDVASLPLAERTRWIEGSPIISPEQHRIPYWPQRAVSRTGVGLRRL